MYGYKFYGYNVDGERLFIVVDMIFGTEYEDTISADMTEVVGMAEYMNDNPRD